jgi:hypothetical protein
MPPGLELTPLHARGCRLPGGTWFLTLNLLQRGQNRYTVRCIELRGRAVQESRTPGTMNPSIPGGSSERRAMMRVEGKRDGMNSIRRNTRVRYCVLRHDAAIYCNE